MTTREQLRRAVSGDRPEPGRGVASEPAPSLPERLYAARERKGVDLYRAERDTKIRARYLGALERGDYKELPGAVYTKGFLRNYALYLGLDPEDVLEQWRRERGDARDAAPVITVPRPIAAPRPGLTFSPSVVVVALLTVVVLAFGAYLAIQVLRFAKPPTISVSDPAAAVIDVDESTTSYTLRGTTLAGGTVTISTPGRDPYQVSAGPDGAWSADVDLRRGRNQFEVSAVDPDTGHATNADSVVVSAAYVGPTGPAPAAPAASAPPPAPSQPDPITVPVADDGSFNTPFELTAGRWSVTVTAASPQGKTVALTRNVTVAYEGVNLVVTVRDGRAWLKVWVDGVLAPDLGAAGSVISAGKTLTFTGQHSVEVRSGSSGNTYFTLNGTSLGALGRTGVPETWLFAPPDSPVKTQRR